jgi:dTDP-4-amino-4,6-dideoxygalactose transaminase
MAKLALMGGPKTVTVDRAKFAVPSVSEEAMAAVVDLMRKGETSNSPIVAEFEREFADYVGSKYGMALTSGTAALHTALFAAGAGPGDEVIAPSYTFIAGASIIAPTGAMAVFADVDRDTMNLDPEDIERKITPRTRALIVCHVWGNPADMDPIMELCRPRGIAVIEDCSHAHGATHKGKKVGSVGDIGCFSCQGGKLVAAGEGGVLTTDNQELYERAILMGRAEKRAEIREDSWSKQFAFTGVGYKFRPHPLGIAIAREQLRHLDEMNDIRDRNGAALDNGLADVADVVPQTVLPDCRRVYAYHYMRYDPDQLGGVSIETFLKALAAEGVRTGRIGYGRLHGQPLFTEGFPYGTERTALTVLEQKPPEMANGPLPTTEHLREYTFSAAPRLEMECRELINQYLEAYHKVASAADELLAYEKEHGEKEPKAQVSGLSVNPVDAPSQGGRG